MKNIIKHVFSFVILSVACASLIAFTPVVHAASVNVGLSDSNVSSLGLSNTSPVTTATNLINLAMTFLGLIAVVIVLIGGFKWMTAGGNEEKTKGARDLIAAGIVGIVIILSAWGIATFVLQKAANATGASVM
jgi:hypothetical protein